MSGPIIAKVSTLGSPTFLSWESTGSNQSEADAGIAGCASAPDLPGLSIFIGYTTTPVSVPRLSEPSLSKNLMLTCPAYLLPGIIWERPLGWWMFPAKHIWPFSQG
jgi:hypothetical protein